jgi:hypothetical protein
METTPIRKPTAKTKILWPQPSITNTINNNNPTTRTWNSSCLQPPPHQLLKKLVYSPTSPALTALAIEAKICLKYVGY